VYTRLVGAKMVAVFWVIFHGQYSSILLSSRIAAVNLVYLLLSSFAALAQPSAARKVIYISYQKRMHLILLFAIAEQPPVIQKNGASTRHFQVALVGSYFKIYFAYWVRQNTKTNYIFMSEAVKTIYFAVVFRVHSVWLKKIRYLI